MPAQITIYTPAGVPINLFNKSPMRSVEKAEQVQDLLGQDVVNISFVTTTPITIGIGSYITVFTKKYFMNQLPSLKRKGERRFTYAIIFEGPQYALRRASFLNADVSGFNTTGDFPLTGPAELFLDVLLNNLERVFGAGVWLKGAFPTTATKTLSFNDTNGLAALQTICKEFETEFDITQGSGTWTINMRKAGEVTGHTYMYGRQGGLYELERNTVDTGDVVTRLFAFGSNKNLKSSYRNFSQRLRLPDPGYIEDAGAVAAFGIRERQVTFEDIFPQRTGSVTAVNSATSFNDSTMFDLNEVDGSGNTKWLIKGTAAKISFISGNLAGYEFLLAEKNGYVHGTKTFNILAVTDARGLALPNETEAAFQLQVGDEYKILDIVMPDSYVETAENELEVEALEYLTANKNPKVQYALTVYELFLKALAGGGSIVNYYNIGDYIRIVDTALSIDKSSRVISINRNITRPYDYKLTIDDTYQTVGLVEIINNIKDTNAIVKVNDLRDVNRARMGWRTMLELQSMVFDTDGYFDAGKIKPESIETMMLVVGAKSQQFILQNVVISPNFNGDANLVDVTAGQLIHYALKDEIVTWQIEASSHTIPDDAPRYIYAKVSKTDYDEGHIVFSTEQILPDSDANYYHFLVGALHSVMDGVRWINLTYGASAINGRFIKTGRIQSFDGLTYFDLDAGTIAGYIKFIDALGNYRDLSDIGASTDRFYAVSVVNALASYTYGKITAWFQASPPDTWPGGDDAQHEGDMWRDSSDGTVHRFTAGAWVAVVDTDTVLQYAKQYQIRGDNTFVRLFTDEPPVPYKDNDLWMSPLGLRRAVKNKVIGQSFDPNDWAEPFNFDNTATAIDGGIITSGTIQLAGDKMAVWAGITGQGTSDGSVRFWAGAAYINRMTAPFRVYQNGVVIGRTKIAVEGVDGSEVSGYKEQAGIAGSTSEGDEGVRIWAGTDYANREDAPFQVNGKGEAILAEGQVGNMKIEDGSLTNRGLDDVFRGDAAVIFRDEDDEVFVGFGTNLLPSTGGDNVGLGRLENNRVVSGGNNYGLILEASGATPGGLGEGGLNFALYANIGESLIGGLVTNGQSKVAITNNTAATLVYVDPTKFNVIEYNTTVNGTFLTLVKEVWNSFPGSGGGAIYENGLKDGNEITILNLNNARTLQIYHTVRPIASSSITLAGGSATTLIYNNGAWYIKSFFDNDY